MINSVRYKIHVQEDNNLGFVELKGTRGFKVPVGAKKNREFDVDLKSKKKFARIKVEILKVTSGSQFDETRIKKEFQVE